MNKERMEDDFFNITIKFAEQDFKTRIKRDQEKLYRNAAICVENKIQAYRKRLPKKGMETHLALVSFELALELLKEKEDKSSVRRKIENLLGELEENLKESL